MKNKVLLIGMSLLLAACGDDGYQEVERAELVHAFKTLSASLLKSDYVKDVSISSNLSFGYELRYKEGEFYSFRNVSLVSTAPVNVQDFTWQENGKYYHCEIRMDDDSTFSREITASEFDFYMAKHRFTILENFSRRLDEIRERLDGSLRFESISNKYLFSERLQCYRFESVATSLDGLGKENHYVVWFDGMKIRSDIEQEGDYYRVWTFIYGQTQFQKPDDQRLDSKTAS